MKGSNQVGNDEFEEYRLRVLHRVRVLQLVLRNIDCDESNEGWWKDVGYGLCELLNFVCGQGEGSSKDGGGPEKAA